MKKSILILFGILFSLPAFSQIADRAFINGKIYTANDAQPFAEAMAIKDGDFIYVGDNSDIDQHINASTVVEDLEGRLMLPGFHDVHMHPLEAGSLVFGDCYLDYYGSTNDLVDQFASCNIQANEHGWILGYGHSIFSLLDSGVNPRIALDEAFPDTPVAIGEATSHSLWVNSKALEMAGIDSNTPDPVGGHIMKLGNGTLLGILMDNAGDIILHEALASTPTIDAQNYDGLVNYGLPLLARNGITSACEARTYWKRNYIDIWKQIQDEDQLTCRMILTPWVYPEDLDSEQIPILESFYENDDPFLRISQLKVYSDGITINATAALHEDYDYNWGLPFDKGLNYIDVTRLSNLITSLETTGFDFHIHAIGDRGVTEGLDAIEFARNQNGDIDARHRITHLEIVDPDDFPRFQQLNALADMQVAGFWTQPQYWQDNADFVGSERADNFIPLKSIFDANARVTLSSDWDVSTLNPFRGIQNALTRAPQQLPSIEEAIKAYTINGAYLMRQEDNTGSIEVGKWADFICVDQDVFTIPTNQIAATEVLCTWVNGEEVYRSDQLPVITSLDILEDSDPLILISPVPTGDLARIQSPTGPIQTFEIYSLTGELIWTENPAGRQSFYVDLTKLAPGTYLAYLQLVSGKRIAKKIIRAPK